MSSAATVLALLAGANMVLLAAEPALMPMPVSITAAPGAFPVDGNLVVETSASGNPARLAPVAAWFKERISRQTGIPFAPAIPAPADAKRLSIVCAGGPEYPTLGEDESYTLDVSEDGAAVRSATVEGAIHGLATFAQLIRPGPAGFQVAGVHIEDRPRYPWRGLMLDVCRHWMPVEVVKRNLDAMAAVKMNVLHWHLSDDEGFRVESKRYPGLQEKGSDGAYYTQDQIRDVVAYARDRGIRVVPEFDVPGHTASWFPGYPELASRPGPFILGDKSGGSVAMDPTRETTYEFLDGFIGEMSALFPDAFWHVGGDEVSPSAWTSNPDIVAYMKANDMGDPGADAASSRKAAGALQVYFNQRLLATVEKYQKTMLGWDEILSPGLPTIAIIHAWRNQASLFDAAAQGYRALMSFGYYLDHLRPAGVYYATDPLSGPGAEDLTAEQAARILGGEACMWSELVGPETVDSRIWPSAAAIAERLWSPKAYTDQEAADLDLMYARLELVSRNLEFTGVKHRANYLPMLERLAGDQPLEPIKTLADASEALGLGTGRAGRPSTWQPLDRFVDAVPPERGLARSLLQAANRLVKDPAGDKDDAALLRAQFQIWAANDARFQSAAANNPLLDEVRPLSRDLSALGAAGLQLLDDLTRNQTPPAGWLAGENAELARISTVARPARGDAQTPRPDVMLAGVRAVKALADGLAPPLLLPHLAPR